VEMLSKVGLIGFELGGRAALRCSDRRSAPLEGPAHRIARDAEHTRDGLDRNPLPVQRHDVHPLFQSDHAVLPALGHRPGDSLLAKEGVHFISSVGGQFDIGSDTDPTSALSRHTAREWVRAARIEMLRAQDKDKEAIALVREWVGLEAQV